MSDSDRRLQERAATPDEVARCPHCGAAKDRSHLGPPCPGSKYDGDPAAVRQHVAEALSSDDEG